MKIAIVSNINLDFLKRTIKNLDVYMPEGYGVWLQELINPYSNLYEFDPDIVFIILDGEQLFPKFDNIESEIEEYFSRFREILSKNLNKVLFISDLDIYTKKIYVNDGEKNEKFIELKWYEHLIKTTNDFSNMHIFNLKEMIENAGRDNFYSYKMWYLGGIKYSIGAENMIAKAIGLNIKAIQGNRKKCLVLDLDGTLWGGVLGEDGMEGIELSEFKEGARYKDFQKRLKELNDIGVILTVVSKNNEEDVMEVLEHHKHMVLKKDNFAIIKANWEPKAKNIREIADELNIGLDSIVFVDDNPIERELVKKELPEVEVPAFPKDTSKLADYAKDIYLKYFYMLKCTEEDVKKTQMYIQNAKRNILKKKIGALDNFLRELNTKIYVWKLRDVDVPRASQLTQKTNQFNLTTKRYTENDIRKFANSKEYDVFIGSVEDKFGDNGKVILLIIKKDKNKKMAEIDTFLMSCRVMGRYIEDQFIDYIENELRKDGIKIVKAFYYPTKKNKPVYNLFERLGYEVVEKGEDNSKVYARDLKKNISRKKFGEVIKS